MTACPVYAACAVTSPHHTHVTEDGRAWCCDRPPPPPDPAQDRPQSITDGSGALPLDLPGTDSDGLPRAVACRWHGAHYHGETCTPPAPGEDPQR